jgi:hypothetical protein
LGDAGEVLVDAEDRFQERMAEREQEQRRSGRSSNDALDPDKARQRVSLTLGKAELTHQLETTSHPVRRAQIERALADIDARLAALG